MNIAAATRKKHIRGVPNPPTDAVWAHQGGRCAICGGLMERAQGGQSRPLGMTIEHVFPKTQGYGLYANKALTHWKCNAARHETPPTPQMLARVRAMYEALLPAETVAALKGRHPLFPGRERRT